MLCVGSSVGDLALEWDFAARWRGLSFSALFFPFWRKKMRAKSLQTRFVDKANDNKRGML